jgi:hypothetical protein
VATVVSVLALAGTSTFHEWAKENVAKSTLQLEESANGSKNRYNVTDLPASTEDNGTLQLEESANGSKNHFYVTDLPARTENNGNDSSTLQLLILLMTLLYMACLLIGLLCSVYIGPDAAKWPLFMAVAVSGVILAISRSFQMTQEVAVESGDLGKVGSLFLDKHDSADTEAAEHGNGDGLSPLEQLIFMVILFHATCFLVGLLCCVSRVISHAA